jgi:hypothetical protein
MKARFLAFVLAASATTAALAQSDFAFVQRIGQQADQLKRATARLAERSLRDVVNGFNNSRADVEDALLAQQMDASAGMLLEMVRARRPVRELRDVAASLADMARLAPTFSPQAALWRPVQNAIAAVSRELGAAPDPAPGPPPRPIIGRVAWRGVVDDRVHLVIREKSVEVRTITGAPQPDGIATFTSPLPARAVDVEATKQAGRGTVRVLQQPARANDFTAVVEVYDAGSGAQEYRLDIVWR